VPTASSATKSWSVEAYSAAAAKVCDDYGVELPEIQNSGGPYVAYVNVPSAGMDLGTLVHRELQKENHA
jgi:hypothetical protein